MEEKRICPQCPRGCSEDSLSCGRGRAYFAAENGEADSSETESAKGFEKGSKKGRHNHKNHGGHHGKPDMNSLYGLMRFCGHTLHHGMKDDTTDPEAMFDALTPEEKEQLKTLLGKLAASWSKNEE